MNNRNVKARRRQLRAARRRTRTTAELRDMRAAAAVRQAAAAADLMMKTMGDGELVQVRTPKPNRYAQGRSLLRAWQRIYQGHGDWTSTSQRDTAELLNR